MRNHNTSRRTPLPVLGTGGARPADGAAVDANGHAARVGVVTLGCDKNTVDSERILAGLHGAGAHVVDDATAADVVIINTCGFIDVAKDESIAAILDAVRLKGDGQVRAVVAMGCLVQRYKAELERELPEVDVLLGLTEAERLVPELRARGLLPASSAGVPLMELPLRRLATRTRHSSYLKVSEGCDHGCAFCAIPLMRGKHRSTPIPRLVHEAAELEADGVVELNIVSQDTTWYGRDLVRGRDSGEGEFYFGKPFAGMAGPRPQTPLTQAHANRRPMQLDTREKRTGLLPDLLRALLDGTAIPWLRLFYMYPSGITRELVDLIAGEPRILPYLDMPIQHGSDAVLERMRRPERRSTILERVAWLRGAIPDLTLRTTVIVGFPGETEDDFEALLDLLEEVRFDRLGAFGYSVEEGTRAAALPNQVSESVRRERLERVLEAQRAITAERNDAWVGRAVTLLIDESGASEAARAVGRTRGQARDIDGVVHVGGAHGTRPGDLVRARITGSEEEDLVAVRVDGESIGR